MFKTCHAQEQQASLDKRLVKCSLSANNAVVTCLSTGSIYHIAPCMHAPGKISGVMFPISLRVDRTLRTHAYALTPHRRIFTVRAHAVTACRSPDPSASRGAQTYPHSISPTDVAVTHLPLDLFCL